MQVNRRTPGHWAVIELDTTQEMSIIRYALSRAGVAADYPPTADNRRAARTAYEALAGPTDDDEWRALWCTGAEHCQCPVDKPCAQRGTSRITGDGSLMPAEIGPA